MNDVEETFDTLWSYYTDKKRLVPMPEHWNHLHGLLQNTHQKPSGGWEPPLPLILAAWHHTMPIEKQLRFKEHLEWARDHEQIDEISAYLRGLREDDWSHFGEP